MMALMVVKPEELRRQLDAAPRVNGGRRRYPARLKARAVEYINGQRRAGKTLSHIAKNLGVAIQTFSHGGPVTKKSLAKPTGTKPVVTVPSIGVPGIHALACR